LSNASARVTTADLNVMSMKHFKELMVSEGGRPKKMKMQDIIQWLKEN